MSFGLPPNPFDPSFTDPWASPAGKRAAAGAAANSSPGIFNDGSYAGGYGGGVPGLSVDSKPFAVPDYLGSTYNASSLDTHSVASSTAGAGGGRYGKSSNYHGNSNNSNNNNNNNRKLYRREGAADNTHRNNGHRNDGRNEGRGIKHSELR